MAKGEATARRLVVNVAVNARSAFDQPPTPARTCSQPPGPWWRPVLFAAAWMCANMAVVLLNKALLTSFAFRQPVLLTTMHMAGFASVTWTLTLTRVYPLTRITQHWRTLALAAVSVCSLVLGNCSLRLLPVSFSQALGSTTPVFTALFAWALQGRRESVLTLCTLLPVVAGVALASGMEPHLHVIGTALCLCAASFRALKTVLQAMLLCKQEDRLDSFSLLAYMSPVATTLLLAALPALEPSAFAAAAGLFSQGWQLPCLCAASCVASFSATWLNMVVTQETSALTLQVIGQAKCGLLAIASVCVFHNRVAPAGWAGYAIAFGGCFAYSQSKWRSARQLAEGSAKRLGPGDKFSYGSLKSHLSDDSDDFMIPVSATSPPTPPFRPAHAVDLTPHPELYRTAPCALPVDIFRLVSH